MTAFEDLTNPHDPQEHGGPAAGRRVLAYVLDPIILVLAMLVLFSVGQAAMGAAADAAWARIENPHAPVPGSVNLAVVVMLTFCIFSLPVAASVVEAWTGATPAKRLLGLRVLGADDRTAPRRHLIARWAIKSPWLAMTVGAQSYDTAWLEWFSVVAAGSWVVALIGCVPGLVGSPTLHDVVTKTKVVKRVSS
jgi:uncharacterized RDD family membrane protein YckC